jgi:hypothetical protein
MGIGYNGSYMTRLCFASRRHAQIEMYILGLRSSWGTLRVCPAWSPSGHILTPALSPFWGAPVRSHACPEDAVYSLNDSCSYFTDVFSLRVLLTNVQRISFYNTYIAHIYVYYTSHSYVHLHSYYTSHSYVRLHLHIFISSAHCGRLVALNSLCPIQLQKVVSYCI